MDFEITPDIGPRNTDNHRKIVSMSDLAGTKSGKRLLLECGHTVLSFGPIENAGGVVLCDYCRRGTGGKAKRQAR